MNKELSSRYESVLKRVVAQWAETPGVAGVILYGSFLSGKMGRYSDLDLMVVKEEDFPLNSCVYLEGELLFNISVVGISEFERKLNKSCLSRMRMMLARHKVLFDPSNKVEELMQQSAPCNDEEADKFSLTLLFHFLLQLGRAENFLDLRENLDSLHHLFHACENSLMLALLRKRLPFDTDLFAVGLSVRPELITALQDLMGHSTYDLALVSSFLELLREERQELLEEYKSVVLKYVPEGVTSLGDLQQIDAFSESGYILFQAYAEAGHLERVGLKKEVPGFSEVMLEEVAFRKS